MSVRDDVPLSTWMPWAAGLYEGEGTVIATRSNSARVYLCSTDLGVLQRFCAVVGSGVIYRKPVVDGLRGPRKQQWSWHVAGVEEAERVYCLFYPWLGGRRREQFERVIAACARKQPLNRVPQNIPAYRQEQERLIGSWVVRPR